MDAVNAGLDEKLFAYLQESIKETAYYKLLGVKLQMLAPGYAEIRVVSNQEHTNPIGLIHGGLIMSIVDAAMGNAIRSLGIKGATVDISTSLTSAARLGDTIVARGKVLKAGKNLIFTEGQVYVGDKLIGDSKATFYKISDLNY
ncbi:MAG: PaaI family thioesterase [Syntrophomonas sp.]|nr:PaaI family thioesterase [Syntrophomonas sp.]